METRLLQYFVITAREKNITRASQILHITQPTLSRQLKKLEDELGTILFIRGQHQLSLTGEGRLFYHRAEEILDTLEIARIELSNSSREVIDKISIGCWQLNSIRELTGLVAAFRQLHPRVIFKITTENTDIILQKLDLGEIDFCLLPDHLFLDKFDYLKMRQKEEWGIYIRKESPLAERERIHISDLNGLPIIMPGNNQISHVLKKSLGVGTSVINPSVVATYNRQFAAAMMADAGIGAAVCLKLEGSFDGLVFLPFEPSVSIGSLFVWRGSNLQTDGKKLFKRFMKEKLTDLSL